MNCINVSKEYMKNTVGDRFDGRLNTGSLAKQRQLERFKVAAADPEKLAKRAVRQVAAEARETQRMAKAANLLREQEDLQRHKNEPAELEETQAMTRVRVLEAERVVAAEGKITHGAVDEAERKAERDRRYAARRNRKR